MKENSLYIFQENFFSKLLSKTTLKMTSKKVSIINSFILVYRNTKLL